VEEKRDFGATIVMEQGLVQGRIAQGAIKKVDNKDLRNRFLL